MHPRRRVLLVVGDQHSLAGRQPVRLDDIGTGMPGEVGQRGSGLGEDLGSSGRNAGAPHDLFGERFGGFQPGCLPTGTEGGHTGSSQRVDHARRQRRLGPHDHQVDALGLGHRGDRSRRGGGHALHQRSQLGEAGIAG